MERIFECKACHNNYEAKYYFLAPFCSERCEFIFCEYAPTHLISEVYENHKKELECEEMPYHIDNIYCEYCRTTIDYGHIDNRVVKLCSELCSDMFLNTLQ